MSTQESGGAGASARQKAERLRHEYDELRARRSGLGRALSALFPSDGERRLLNDEHSWRTGAQGEESLAAFLAERCRGVLLLNDRRAPGSRANIDHLAVAPSGVYVIDCKRYRGKVEVRRPLFGKEQLRIKGRDRTALIDGLEKQVAYLKSALSDVPDAVPVHACLCFVAPEGFLADGGLPVLRTLTVHGYPLYTPRRLAKRLQERGPVTPDQAEVIGSELHERLPPALPG
jgi:hypothetical protein